MKLARGICFRSQRHNQWEESIQISTRGRTICMCTWNASASFSSELTCPQLHGPNNQSGFGRRIGRTYQKQPTFVGAPAILRACGPLSSGQYKRASTTSLVLPVYYFKIGSLNTFQQIKRLSVKTPSRVVDVKLKKTQLKASFAYGP